MKKLAILILSLTCLQMSAQITTYNINNTIICTDTLHPFGSHTLSYGLSIDGEGQLLSDTAFDARCEFALSQLPMCKGAGMSPETQREGPRPYWVDTIVSQPEGYLTDAYGNVEISTSDGLVWLASVVNGLNGCEPDDFRGRTVKLTDDIDFGENGWDLCFSPVGTRETPFAGTFDGGGHTIHHMLQYYSIYDGVNNYYFDMGIFGYIRNAVVKDLALDSTCSIISNCNYPGYYRGGVVGFADSLSVVDNIYVYSPRGFISHVYGSGIVGMNRNSTVRNCALKGRTAAPENGATLVAYNRSEGGYADAVVENCYSHGQPGSSFSTWYAGGLVCFNQTASDNNGKQAIIRNCHSTPTNDLVGYSAQGAFAAVLSEGSRIDHCYYDPTWCQHPKMVGLNQGGELLYCCEYTNVDGTGTLALPVTVNGILTDNLLDALNLWIEEQDCPELYRTWAMLTDTVPVFGGYHVGVHENGAGTENVTVYPNPADGIVTVTGKTLRQAEVFNAAGQCTATATGTEDEIRIDLRQLPAGIYFVTVTDAEGRKCVKKVVKE